MPAGSITRWLTSSRTSLELHQLYGRNCGPPALTHLDQEVDDVVRGGVDLHHRFVTVAQGRKTRRATMTGPLPAPARCRHSPVADLPRVFRLALYVLRPQAIGAWRTAANVDLLRVITRYSAPGATRILRMAFRHTRSSDLLYSQSCAHQSRRNTGTVSESS